MVGSWSTLAAAACELGWADDGFVPDVRVADPRFGDFQANGILPFAKRKRQNPRVLAQALADRFNEGGELRGLANLSVAGAGFVNFALQSE